MREPRTVFWVLALGQCLLWLVFAKISQEFVYGVDHSLRPVLPILGVMALAFLLYLVSVFRVWNKNDWLKPWHVLALAVLMRVPLLFWSSPVQEIDYYRYLWDGRVLFSGVSPYQYSPSDVDEILAWETADQSESASKLVRIIERSPVMETAFQRIDHREVPTIYPLTSQLVFAAAAFLIPEQAPLQFHLIVIRLVMSCFDLGVVVLLLTFLKRQHLPPGRAIVYACCPLVLKEFANSGHMDVIAIFLVTAAFILFAGSAGTTSKLPGRKVVFSAVLWAGAVLAKWYPLVLAPILLSFGWKKWGWRFCLPVLVAAAIIGTGIQLSRSNSVKPNEISAKHDELTGLRTFLTRWEMNDLFFSIVRENLNVRVSEKESGLEKREPWYAVVPKSIRWKWDAAFRDLAARVGFKESTLDPAFLTAQIASGLIILLVALWLSFRPWPDERDGEELAGRIFIILAVSWYVSATQNPWYWAWALPFVIFAKSRIWLLVSGVALIYYLRFWLIYQYPSPTWHGLDGERIFDEVIVWFEHFSILLLLFFLGITSLVHASNIKRSIKLPIKSP